MKEIIVKSKKYGNRIAIVDDEDYEELSKYNWYVQKSKNTCYAYRRGLKSDQEKRFSISMHRSVLGVIYTDADKVVDHENGNGLDNRKENLRLCVGYENSRNTRVDNQHTLNSSSKYKGVSWDNHRNRWRTYICINGKIKWLRITSDEKIAAMVYDLAAIKYFGEFACLNFPDARDRIDEFEIAITNNRLEFTEQTSKYFGVTSCGKKWRAIFKGKHLGYHNSEYEAHIAVENYKSNNENN